MILNIWKSTYRLVVVTSSGTLNYKIQQLQCQSNMNKDSSYLHITLIIAKFLVASLAIGVSHASRSMHKLLLTNHLASFPWPKEW